MNPSFDEIMNTDELKRQMQEQEGAVDAPRLVRSFTMLEPDRNYGVCGFCKCRTNAKRRACCTQGREEDDFLSSANEPRTPTR